MIILFVLLGFLAGGLVNQLGSDLPAFSTSRSIDQDNPLDTHLPPRRRLTRPHCRHCGNGRPWWQWVAIPSFLIGRARCPTCGKRIGLRHPLIEVGLAATFGYLWVAFGPSIELGLYLVYAIVYALVLITDIERRLILNVVTYPAILFALVASTFTPGIQLWSALAGGAICFAFFLLAMILGNALFGSGALGEGDVKLAAFVGLTVGYPLVIEALVLIIICGAAISALLLITGLRRLRDHIPYGPFIVIGGAATLLWGYPIAEWFLR